jgi:hypothetical protein
MLLKKYLIILQHKGFPITDEHFIAADAEPALTEKQARTRAINIVQNKLYELLALKNDIQLLSLEKLTDKHYRR